jgi:hypothetical protein
VVGWEDNERKWKDDLGKCDDKVLVWLRYTSFLETQAWFCFTTPWFLYFFLQFVACILGAFVSPALLSLLLLDVIIRNEELQFAVSAVVINAKALFLTALLTLMFVYMFTGLGFHYLRYVFQDKHNFPICTTLLECFSYTAGQGLLQGGGVGDVVYYVDAEDPRFLVTSLWNLGFWIIIIIVCLNIVFGMIIDTFASLRDTKIGE